MRIPIKATVRKPIDRPDTYQRLPLVMHTLTCDQQPVHTFWRVGLSNVGQVVDTNDRDFVIPVLSTSQQERALSSLL